MALLPLLLVFILVPLSYFVPWCPLSAVPSVGHQPRADIVLHRSDHERELPRRAARVGAGRGAGGGHRHKGVCNRGPGDSQVRGRGRGGPRLGL